MDPHLLRGQIHAWWRPHARILAVAELVDRNRRAVAVRHGPNDVLRAKRGITPEKDLWNGRLKGLFIDDRHVPSIEFETNIPLDPGKGVLLSDRDQDIVAFEVLVRITSCDKTPPAVFVGRFHLLERHALKLALVVIEFLRYQIVEDRYILVHRVFLFPRRGLHLLETRADDDLDILATQSFR